MFPPSGIVHDKFGNYCASTTSFHCSGLLVAPVHEADLCSSLVMCPPPPPLPSFPQEYVLKAVVNLMVGQLEHSTDHLTIAQQV